jgi:ribosomal protein S18 acetylase RimI-like enzyme
MKPLEYSKPDSERFGLVIYRTKTEEIDANELLSQIIQHNVDTAIVRIPTEQLSQIHKLEKMAMPFMITDTLAYYDKDLSSYQPETLDNKDLEFILATPEHHELLNYIVRATFGTYVNHYRMNPFFHNENVTEGYQDWVRSYAENNPERICWLVKRHGEVVGFGTFNYQFEGRVEGILYGVLPHLRRAGIFKDIMRYAKNHSKSKGYEMIRCTTQIENRAVQRLWTDSGFFLHHTENTIHINALLTKTVFDGFTIPLTISAEEANFNKVTNRQILKQLNWHFDFKQNIVTQNHRFVNIKPLKMGDDYFLKFSFPAGNVGLLRVIDHTGETYMLVYFDLKHFVS